MVPSGRRVRAPWRKGGRAAGASRLHHPPGLSPASLALRPRASTTPARGSHPSSAARYRRPLASSGRARLVREPETVQRLVQPAAARVAREHAAGAVRAVRRGREPDDEQPRPRVAEPGHRLPPVGPVPELALLLAGDEAAVSAQPGAALAGDHGAEHGPERAGRETRQAPGRVTPSEASG